MKPSYCFDDCDIAADGLSIGSSLYRAAYTSALAHSSRTVPDPDEMVICIMP